MIVMIFLGIDPGLNRTGVGVVEVSPQDKRVRYVYHQTIAPNPKQPLTMRLGVLSQSLHTILGKHNVAMAAIEDIFVSTNIRSALLLGQARGALIGSVALRGIPMAELTALQIKKGVTGYGRATKDQVQKMVEMELGVRLKSNEGDAADALACAITLAYSKHLQEDAKLSRGDALASKRTKKPAQS